MRGGWGNYDLASLGVESSLADGSPIEPTSTWCWVTGDQHLSNFGAWQNRRGTIVFTVNDFDEAVIYDFQIDVWRVAVSIYNHGLSNGLGAAEAEAAVLTFTSTYVQTLISYVGNDDALLFELTPKTATGKLADFLGSTHEKNSHHKMIEKFTEVSLVCLRSSLPLSVTLSLCYCVWHRWHRTARSATSCAAPRRSSATCLPS